MNQMMISGRIESGSVTASLSRINGDFSHTIQYSLRIRADRDTKIVLSDGTHISENVIHLTLFVSTETNHEILKKISENEIGFLTFNPTTNESHIGGAAYSPSSEAFLHFVKASSDAGILIYLSNIEERSSYAPPFTWVPGRDGQLKISSFSLSASG